MEKEKDSFGLLKKSKKNIAKEPIKENSEKSKAAFEEIKKKTRKIIIGCIVTIIIAVAGVLIYKSIR